MTPDERIEQFRKMAQANPDDDLAHFAFGQALIDAGRHGEAVGALKYTTRISPDFSKAWLLLGQAHAGSGDDQTAVEVWQQGHSVARRRGDLMVVRDLENLLRANGAEIPAAEDQIVGIEEPVDDREPGEGEIRDLRTGRVGQRMAFDPFGDEVGAFIQAHISQESWEAWMDMSIKVINELRLDLGDPEAQRTYDQHMRDFLNLPGALFEGKEYE